MFTVYHSNQLDLLKTLAATLIASKPLLNPFQSEIILVQSTGMEQWLQMELATHFGIAANIEFLFLDRFIWQMYTLIITNFPEDSVFIKTSMVWRLMDILPKLHQEHYFLNEYLRDNEDPLKIFQFATRVADLFDKYLVYRPDWLDSWQKGKLIDDLGKAQLWQAPLWRELIEETQRLGYPLWHRANSYKLFIHTLETSLNRPPGIPERIFICGISSIPPIYLQVLQALGNSYIDIHMFFINPCRSYWWGSNDSDSISQLLHQQKYYRKKNVEQTLLLNNKYVNSLFNDTEEEHGNPLLASWGKQGRDNLYNLAQMESIADIEAFVEPVNNNLLSILQKDILLLEDHSKINISNNLLEKKIDKKRLLQKNDQSLSLHVCHSIQREVEVLHDNLLSMIVADPTIRPRDIIVMMADIDIYMPSIKAVFGNVSSERYLPFNISDRSMRHLHPIIQTFLNLLKLPHSRFTAEQILEFLEVPALASRFSIKEKELQLLRHWVTESGIRWGLDDETLRELMLPTTCQHTWQFGLNRMLLGYAMDSASGDWQGILPYDESSGLIACIAGQLAELLMQLRQWRDWLAKSHYLKDWLGCARKIIKDFFVSNAETEAALVFLENKWQQMLQSCFKMKYQNMIPVTILHYELTTRLDQELSNHSFLSGTVNFCTLIPMRSIPFRIVCLLGMNSDIYPRQLSISGFDLMVKQPRIGDRNQYDDDKYMFLEALLSAQQRLYISFIGRSIQDNRLRYPSVLVNELIDYIAHSFYLPGEEYVNDDISSVRKHLCQWHSRMPFAPENFFPGSKIQSFASEWLPAANAAALDKGNPQFEFINSFTSMSCDTFSLETLSLSLDELLRFYRHPVRTWFIQRLAVSFHQTSMKKLPEEEPFIIDNITNYQVNKQILNTILNRESTHILFRKVSSSGLLPHGAFGKIYWDRQCKQMATLSEKIQVLRLPDRWNVNIHLNFDNVTLSGKLQVQANGLLRWRPGTLSVRDGLLLWLEHLTYCAMDGKGESRILGTCGEWHFAPLPVFQAKHFLKSFISGYCNGMMLPLLLLPIAGGAWLSHCYNKITKSIDREEKTQQLARKKLINAWKGNAHLFGENKDPYLQHLIRQLNEQHIELIISAAELYLLPIFKFNMALN
ncbi:exodeoxyribonuclease V subunit gamma [Candidatus Mikella endobia]|nr:exodeoxyribonuclease V subunit gamma [Candidatus Mikella endobia]